MDRIKFISHNTIGTLDAIKQAVLYFDFIDIATYIQWFAILPKEIVKGSQKVDFFPAEMFKERTFYEHLKPLAQEGLIKFSHELYEPLHRETIFEAGPPFNKKVLGIYFEGVGDLVSKNVVKLYKSHRGTIDLRLNDKIQSISGIFNDECMELISDLKVESDGLTFALKYYSHLLSVFLSNLDEGNICMTDSENLNNFLAAHFNGSPFQETKRRFNREINVNPNIAFEAIKLSLPNISKLSFDDILNIRYKMQDELGAFKTYLKSLQLDLEKDYNDNLLSLKAKEIVKTKIAPALEDISHKLNGLKVGVASSLLQEIKDPKSYSPLLLTLTNNFSSTYAILVSLGIISFNAAIESYSSKREIKSNGLYYLLKLKSVN
jgi:hypothetical protein